MNKQINLIDRAHFIGELTPLMSTLLRFVAVTVVAISMTACNEGHQGGYATKSGDGKTYLSVIDDKGGRCRPIIVDGKLWPHKMGEAGPINPGRHEIACGGQIKFDVPAGVIFHFQYR